MSARLNIEKRLQLLGIDDQTMAAIAYLRPALLSKFEHLVEDFYRHILMFPDARSAFASADMTRLRAKQKLHWLRLFDCTFDADYVAGALHVGEVHFERGVAPYIYIAGYNFFHCQLVQLALRHTNDPDVLSEVLMALTRIISLDMDLALSAYTREQLMHSKVLKKPRDVTWV